MPLITIFSSLSEFMRTRILNNKVTIDLVFFRLHYMFTTTIFIACSALACTHNFFGEPISCISSSYSIPQNIINTYCLITSTFTVPNSKYKHDYVDYLGKPGLSGSDPDAAHHSYYQWVAFMLFFQGFLFTVPHLIWTFWDNNKIRMITDGVRGIFYKKNDDVNYHRKLLVNYLVETLYKHNVYAAMYFFCEVLNFANVVGNIFLINYFLGGEFLMYGVKFLKFYLFKDNPYQANPLLVLFPRLTKCTFKMYGSSGTMEEHDSLCLLSTNVLNEKIYLVLWFWLLFLAAVSLVSLVFYLFCLIPLFRKVILRHRFKFNPSRPVSTLVKKIQFGDFFLLHLISQNINSTLYTQVLEDMYSCLILGHNVQTDCSVLKSSVTELFE